MEALFWGSVLRAIQAASSAAPTVMIGLFVAAVLDTLIGTRRTRLIFGEGTWRALPQAWVLGMLLPVCSLGVIPIASRLRKASLSGGTILAFAVSAPLFNPLSLLYGLTLSQPVVILTFAMFSLAVVTAVGCLWDRLFRTPDGAPSSATETAESTRGWRRMAMLFLSLLRQAGSTSQWFVLAGLAGVALLAALLPPGDLQTSAERDDWKAPITMAMVAVPAYVTPLGVMSQIGSMFMHGNSVGAAFVLLVLGAGLNLGLVVWTLVYFGWRRGTAWLAILILIVLGLAYAGDKPLTASDVEAAGHTHAFDGYCSPFAANASQPYAHFRQRLNDTVPTFERWLIAGWVALVVTGLALNVADPQRRMENWLVSAASGNALTASWDREVSPPLIGAVALAGLVAFSVVGCYAYYPEPKECFEEIRILRTNVETEGILLDQKQLEHWAPLLEDWTRRLQVGATLRGYQINEYLRMKARVCNECLELLEHAVAEKDRDEARKFALALDRAHLRLRRAFEEHFAISTH